VWLTSVAKKGNFMRLLEVAVSAFIVATSLVYADKGEWGMHEGFIDVAVAVPGIIVEPRYASSDNFMGRPITGYEAAKTIVSKPVGKALVAVQAELIAEGLSLKIYDGYRPQRAVDHFMRWIADVDDQKNKADYYPNVLKKDLVGLGYIAEKSGHSRGGSVDLTLVQRAADGTWQDMDMGSTWDMLDEKSHLASTDVDAEAQANRKMLANLMIRHGFLPYSEEWWHFTLDAEPYPDTYFDFPIR
jgi:D-alanyl-D-alanine dipeptidase